MPGLGREPTRYSRTDGILMEFGGSGSDWEMHLLCLTEALARRWEERQIVMLVDEIYFKANKVSQIQ